MIPGTYLNFSYFAISFSLNWIFQNLILRLPFVTLLSWIFLPCPSNWATDTIAEELDLMNQNEFAYESLSISLYEYVKVS